MVVIRKVYARLLASLIVLLFIITACNPGYGQLGGNTLNSKREIPPIDAAVPATIETATFALG